MTPNDFITKWRASELKERSASQEHFIDLCRLLGEPTPADADPTGETYCFERGARRDAGGDGWADVWKRHHFAWEYKGRRANLDAAFNQLRQYALALENPPLLIVSDMVRLPRRSRPSAAARFHRLGVDWPMPHSGPSDQQPAHKDKRRALKRELSEATLDLRRRLGDNTPTSTTSQAVYHWTLADQLEDLEKARDAEPELGFMMRLLALCTLPRTNLGDRTQYVRRNGPYTLIMSAVGQEKLPFGNLPRLLLAWVCTETVRTQSRTLKLGRSLSEFMRKLDITNHSGGVRGDRTRLKNQMQRLFSANVMLIEKQSHRERAVSSNIVDRRDYWWDPKGDQPMLWDSTIELGEMFYDEIVSCPVPLDMHILRSMKRSALGLDLYLWLNYRMFKLREPLRLTWRQLYRQFGPTNKADKVTINNFRAQVLRELAKLKDAWPQLDYRTPMGCLDLHPSPLRIAPARQNDD